MSGYLFDKTRSDSYDDAIRHSILGYDALHSLTARLAVTINPNINSVLLIGAGTGQELEVFSKVSNSCRFSIVEPSEEMRARCENRISDLNLQSRVSGVFSSIDDLPSDSRFDCVTLLLVLHFVPDNGEKNSLASKIYEKMTVSSNLFVADLCRENSEVDDYFIETWRSSMIIEGSPKEEVEDFFRNRLQLVQRVSQERTQQVLSEAGFVNQPNYFSSLLFRAWIARKFAPRPRDAQS